jgi:hypothetical protein
VDDGAKPAAAAAKFKFRFGDLQQNILWDEDQSPLDKARPPVLRSIQQECLANDGGKWRVEYEYVASCAAHEGTWEFVEGATDPDMQGARQHCSWPAVRDLGHAGKKLEWFAALPAARKNNLTLPEVAMLRLYTGPMFRPLNNALREVGKHGGRETLQQWWTCVAVLVCAVFKLSFANSGDVVDASVQKFAGGSNSDGGAPSRNAAAADQAGRARHSPARPVLDVTMEARASKRSAAEGPREVFRGLPVSSLTDCDATSGDVTLSSALNFEQKGGVELAFCSTTTDRNVALAFSKGEGGVLLRFALSSTTRAAGVQWASQYPGEAEWLLPPFTALQPTPSSLPRRSSGAPSSKQESGARKPASTLLGSPTSMRELRFTATVRVPFQELNMRALALEAIPVLPDRDALLLYEAPGGHGYGGGSADSGAGDCRLTSRSFDCSYTEAETEQGVSSEAMHARLRRERVVAGIVSFERGFFGGIGVRGALVHCACGLGLIGFVVTLLIEAVQLPPPSPTSNGPLHGGATGVLALIAALGWVARGGVLLKLNALVSEQANQVIRDGFRCALVSDDGVSRRQSARSLQDQDPWESIAAGVNPGFEAQDPRESTAAGVTQDVSNAVHLWEERAVDSLPQLWYLTSWITVLVALNYFWICWDVHKAGFAVPVDPNDPRGIPAFWLGIAFLVSGLMSRWFAVSIASGRKRFAQTISTNYAGFCGMVFACSNLPFAFGIADAAGSDLFQAWLRGGGGLLCSLAIGWMKYGRWRADREAEAGVLEDQAIYDRIMASILRDDGEALKRVASMCNDANALAAKILLQPGGGRGTVCDPRQGNPLRVPILFSGKYLAHLFKLARAWSSEFRQVTTKLAVMSGCRLEVPSGRHFDGIKDPKRAIEKVCRVYGGHCDRVLDLLRATIVADDVSQIETALELLTSGFDKRVSVRRIKNKFEARIVKGGFRNIHINLVLTRQGAPPESGFLCELQVQHREIFEAEQGNDREVATPQGMRWLTPHQRYILYRNYRAE